ncbi:MAG: cytochrome-c peroxidase [Gammaproteobacteria bacterium RBG_16_51_14]|nr:MAG: cytochrome-c peroxidase [Gammaproteobacteria bacterium RBG_16_51_14]
MLCIVTSGWFELAFAGDKQPLGLPPVPIPEANPQSPEKVALGKQLYEDKRFSSDGTVSCSTCHDPLKGFTDHLPVSEGVGKQKGTRNAPTVINAAYYTSQFWDGRRPDLESQSKDPLLNPIEHGLKDHGFVINVIRDDASYPASFKEVFGVTPEQITIDHVALAIASFERTVIAGDSPFDRYLYGGDKTAMSESAIRGLDVFRNNGRCADCHKIDPKSAIFTDNKFHNLGVGFKRIEANMFDIVEKFRIAKNEGNNIDENVLTNAEASELGRFAVTLDTQDLGRFKTSTIRNITVTGPFMHDGSQKTLEEVVDFYNQGGEKNPVLDSGIRPLNLTDQEKKDLVEFMKALTSPQFVM